MTRAVHDETVTGLGTMPGAPVGHRPARRHCRQLMWRKVTVPLGRSPVHHFPKDTLVLLSIMT